MSLGGLRGIADPTQTQELSMFCACLLLRLTCMDEAEQERVRGMQYYSPPVQLGSGDGWVASGC